MHSIDIFRGEEVLANIKPDDNSGQVKTLLGSNKITLIFQDYRYIPFTINDYCTVFKEKYIINRQPVITKSSEEFFDYTLEMVSDGDTLNRIQYLFLGSLNELTETDFSLMGNPLTFMQLLLTNIHRVDPDWALGEVVAGDYLNLTFSEVNCFNALGQIATAFKTEFYIRGKVISLTKVQNDTGYTYRQGKAKGLYTITPMPLDSTDLVTRLYIKGSDKNLPPLYHGGSTRLQIPGSDPCLVGNVSIKNQGWSAVDGSKIRFTFDPPSGGDVTGLIVHYQNLSTPSINGQMAFPNASPIDMSVPFGAYRFTFETVATGDCGGKTTSPIYTTTLGTGQQTPSALPTYLAYLENNVDRYGVIEGVKVFDDIYPHRTGTVTGSDPTNPFKFYDGSMDFDINDYLVPGIAAKVTFNTGQLAGYTFEIASYSVEDTMFIININKDETALQVPSDSLRPAIGDQYVLVDIIMPQTYITAAELQLKVAAETALAQLSVQQQKFSVDFDPVYLRSSGKIPRIGDMIWLVDDQFQLNRRIRVITTTRGIVDEFDLKVELADTVEAGVIASLKTDTQQVSSAVDNLSYANSNKRIFNNNVIGDLRIDQGTLIVSSMPLHPTGSGFSNLVIDNATGKIYKS